MHFSIGHIKACINCAFISDFHFLKIYLVLWKIVFVGNVKKYHSKNYHKKFIIMYKYVKNWTGNLWIHTFQEINLDSIQWLLFITDLDVFKNTLRNILKKWVKIACFGVSVSKFFTEGGLIIYGAKRMIKANKHNTKTNANWLILLSYGPEHAVYTFRWIRPYIESDISNWLLTQVFYSLV